MANYININDFVLNSKKGSCRNHGAALRIGVTSWDWAPAPGRSAVVPFHSIAELRNLITAGRVSVALNIKTGELRVAGKQSESWKIFQHGLRTSTGADPVLRHFIDCEREPAPVNAVDTRTCKTVADAEKALTECPVLDLDLDLS